MDLNQPLTGSCLCGALTYRSSAIPLTVWACHCTDCQDATNSDYQLTVLWQAEKFSHVSGDFKVWRRTGDSGRDLKIHFCPECGSRVFYHIDSGAGSQIMFTPGGTLDDKGWVKPVANLWTVSARPWVNIDPNWLNFENQPEGEGFLPLFNAYAEWAERERLAA